MPTADKKDANVLPNLMETRPGNPGFHLPVYLAGTFQNVTRLNNSLVKGYAGIIHADFSRKPMKSWSGDHDDRFGPGYTACRTIKIQI